MDRVSFLDCIKRVPQRIEWILQHREESLKPLNAAYSRRAKEWDEVVLIGCGTSTTVSFTARYLAQSYAGIRFTPVLPDDFMHYAAVRNPNALYVFISQTGTSVLTNQALALAKSLGYDTLAMSEADTTPIVKDAGAFLNIGCGYEEYPMRTIGYSTSVMTLILLGVWIGKMNGKLPAEQEEIFLRDSHNSAAQILPMIDKTLAWLEKERRQMLRSDCLVFTGSGNLFGVAQEAAVKIWETPQMISFGCDLEEGLHGPNYGYTSRHCVIALCDDGPTSQKAQSLIAYMKNEKQNGFLIGSHPLDDHDLYFDCQSSMSWMVFAAVVQTIACHLAMMQGRDLFAPHDNHVMYSYFDTHNELSSQRTQK